MEGSDGTCEDTTDTTMFVQNEEAKCVICMLPFTCVGSVCVGVTALMCHGRFVHNWVRKLGVSPSTCRWSVEVYVSHDPHQGVTVVFGYIEVSCERFVPNIYRCIHT